MTANAVIALLREIIATLPAAIVTGQQVIKLVNDAYQNLRDAIADREVSPQEIDSLVARIVAASALIQAQD